MEKKLKSHKEWRKDAKKQRRKIRRTKLALKIKSLLENELNDNLKNPIFLTKLADQNALELIATEAELKRSAEEHKKWFEYDKKYQKIWNEKQQKIIERDKAKEVERQRIKNEYEMQQKRLAEIERDKLLLIEEQKKKYEILSTKINEYIYGFSENVPTELLEISETNPGKQDCIFFTKTGCCRYGFKCIRNHRRPGLSRMLLLLNFFTHIRLEQSDATEYGQDLALEYDDSDLQFAFLDFFKDVVPEFEQFGKILQFRICHNLDQHLRGNVYVEYENERDALKTFRHMKGRYYAGRMLNIEFAPNIPWKNAICGMLCGLIKSIACNNLGLSLANQCLKGRSCNYLHVFKNPHNKFPLFVASTRNNTNHIGHITASVTMNSSKNPNSNLATNHSNSWDDEDNNNHRKRSRDWRWSESPDRSDLSICLSRNNVQKCSQTSSQQLRRSSDSSTAKSYSQSSSSRSNSKRTKKTSETSKKKKKSSRDSYSRSSPSSKRNSSTIKKRKKRRSKSRS